MLTPSKQMISRQDLKQSKLWREEKDNNVVINIISIHYFCNSALIIVAVCDMSIE